MCPYEDAMREEEASSNAPSRSIPTCSLPGGLDCCSIVWLAHLISDVLRIGDVVVPADHKDRPLEQEPLLEQHSVVSPELLAPLRGEELVHDSFGSLPASLCEGESILTV